MCDARHPRQERAKPTVAFSTLVAFVAVIAWIVLPTPSALSGEGEGDCTAQSKCVCIAKEFHDGGTTPPFTINWNGLDNSGNGCCDGTQICTTPKACKWAGTGNLEVTWTAGAGGGAWKYNEPGGGSSWVSFSGSTASIPVGSSQAPLEKACDQHREYEIQFWEDEAHLGTVRITFKCNNCSGATS